MNIIHDPAQNMSIVFAAIVPHPPLLFPSVGKENSKQLKKTAEGYKKIEEDLYASQPTTILIISPHGCILENSFSINQGPEYVANLESFGDFSTKNTLNGNVLLTHRIRENLETKAPLQMQSEAKLDYGTSIPLMLLTTHLPKVKVIPLYYCGKNIESNFKFGELLKNELMLSQERIAVIASGDLSHRLTKNSPAGYSPKAKKFDKKVIEILLAQRTGEILSMDEELLHEVCECGLKSIALLLGILERIKYEPKLISYEGPFGIGYMIMEYKIG